ncbi:MAG: hypothetical protein M1129_05510 [Candidatus Thermoplasmatota archaeon]|nr:hypothetical protein [Candidatus Thermoplasmatota archaeon]
MTGQRISIPSSPRLNAAFWLVTFAIFSLLSYLLEGYHWQEALLSGVVVASVYVGSRVMIVIVLRQKEINKVQKQGKESP